jgi:hypothetical protein
MMIPMPSDVASGAYDGWYLFSSIHINVGNRFAMIALGFDRVYQASKRAIVNVSSTNSAANTLNMIGGSAVEQQQPMFLWWDSPMYLWRSASPRLALEA